MTLVFVVSFRTSQEKKHKYTTLPEANDCCREKKVIHKQEALNEVGVSPEEKPESAQKVSFAETQLWRRHQIAPQLATHA